MAANKRLIFYAFAAALAAIIFHVGALYHLHLAQLGTISGIPPRMENQSSIKEHPSAEKEKEVIRRNNELSVVFNNVKPIEAETLKSEFSPSSLLANDVEEDTPLELPEGTTEDAAIDQPEEFNIKSDDVAIENENAIRGERVASTSYEHTASGSDSIITELILATNMMQGDLLDPEAETLSTPNSIRSGHTEMASLDGNALDSNEGFQDAAASLEDAEPSSFSADFGISPSLDLLPAMLQGHPTSRLPNAPGQFILTGGTNKEKSAATLPNSRTFYVQVDFVPEKGPSGYIFRITLYPKEGIRFKRITQNYYFLIDRSHSIRPQRYELTKAAVSDALSSLQKEDSFNVLVFDDEVVSFANEKVPATPENIANAQRFIKGQKYGQPFTTTDLYSSIGRIIPASMPEKEVNTAILLSDGDTFLSRDKQRETIGSWTAQNNGKVSLYSLPTGGRNNLALLGLLSSFNKGYVLHAKRDRDVGSTLLSLLEQIRNPIGKEMTATAIVKDGAANVVLYPAAKRLPNLYEDSPYIIVGTTNSLDDFHLFLQGRYYDNILDMKMHIDFNKATPIADGSIEQQLAQQQAYGYYDNYLRDGKREHLNKAKKLLAPFRTGVPFQ